MGIGEAIAMTLAEKGMDVALLARSGVMIIKNVNYTAVVDTVSGQAGGCEGSNREQMPRCQCSRL